ncbi:MAG TPA: hypothetical protein VFP84_25890 [Kofleriaceae bacterium]|nr:hypothetical protein [Kofleriaceae bacterium]
MRIAFAACVLALAGCHEPSPPAAAPAPTAAPAADQPPSREEHTMENGARSPAGDVHPGEVVHDDKIEGKTWTRAAAEVPTSIAWVHVAGAWKPVTRIEITGTVDQRRITKFGADGQMLETTIQAPPPGRGRPAAPAPAPTPVPTPTPKRG